MEWFKNKRIGVYFDTLPDIRPRVLSPAASEQEKRSVKKYPFISKQNLKVNVFDYKKNKRYKFTIPKDYCFDGASIPRFFWRAIGANSDPTFLVAALVHDYMCENHHVVGNDRYLSTLIFDNCLEVGGVNSFKRWLMKHSVDNYQKFCGWKK